MVLEPHDLHHEFPEHGEAIHDLKLSKCALRAAFRRVPWVNKARSASRNACRTGDRRRNSRSLRQRRLKLKDELYAILRARRRPEKTR